MVFHFALTVIMADMAGRYPLAFVLTLTGGKRSLTMSNSRFFNIRNLKQ